MTEINLNENRKLMYEYVAVQITEVHSVLDKLRAVQCPPPPLLVNYYKYCLLCTRFRAAECMRREATAIPLEGAGRVKPPPKRQISTQPVIYLRN